MRGALLSFALMTAALGCNVPQRTRTSPALIPGPLSAADSKKLEDERIAAAEMKRRRKALRRNENQ